MNESKAVVLNRGWAFWVITLAACTGVLIAAALGQWQMSRAAQKEALEAEMSARAAQSPLPSAELSALLVPGALKDKFSGNLFRQVQLRGHWAPENTVYLDNRQMHGKQGFFVFTPLLLSGHAGSAIMVQRGWAPRHFKQREQLPAVITDTGEVEVLGYVSGPPAQTYALGSGREESGFSRIRQNLALDDFREETGLALAPFTVIQLGAASEGLMRDWSPAATGVEKHYGYAFQWFALCALIAGLYVWFQLVRPRWRA